MNRLNWVLILSLVITAGCRSNKPAANASGPYAAQPAPERERIFERPSYDATHDPEDTMSVNSMGSD